MAQETYTAILYQGSSKIHGHVSLVNRHLVFRPSDGQVQETTWDEYSISATFEDELVGIHSTLEPDKSIFVRDRNFATVFAKELGVKIQTSFFHWWGRRPFRAAVALTAIIFAMTILFLATLRTQGKFFARFVTPEQEKALGAAAMESGFEELEVKLPPNLQKEWDALLANLLNQPDLKSREWKVMISKDDVVNAFALPGGFVVFNAGFIEQAESADEIIGVLAHEVAHVTERHTVQSLAGDMSANILLSVLFLGSSHIMSGLLFAADGLHSLEYSRRHELEADNLGVKYLQRAGLTTDGMYAFFSRSKDEGDPSADSLSYLSTHPMDDERLKLIRRLDPKREGKKINYDLADLKAFLNEAR
jgi:beta-barrel assembly-enhancing protease